MSAPQRVAVTVPEDVAAEIQIAIELGEYASSSDAIEEALRDWKIKHARELAELKAKIDEGIADADAGRVVDYNEDRIVELGRKLLRSRSRSS